MCGTSVTLVSRIHRGALDHLTGQTITVNDYTHTERGGTTVSPSMCMIVECKQVCTESFYVCDHNIFLRNHILKKASLLRVVD